MRVDGEVRDATPTNIPMRDGKLPRQTGYIAGSKAVDTVDRLITSLESYFHPSNSGQWTLSVSKSELSLRAQSDVDTAHYFYPTFGS